MGYGKSNPLPLRIALSGGNVRPRESSPLSGVGGVSGLPIGPGSCGAVAMLQGLCMCVGGVAFEEAPRGGGGLRKSPKESCFSDRDSYPELLTPP